MVEEAKGEVRLRSPFERFVPLAGDKAQKSCCIASAGRSAVEPGVSVAGTAAPAGGRLGMGGGANVGHERNSS